MKELADVQSINAQIVAIAGRIGILSDGINASTAVTEDLKKVYEDQLIDEIHHMQILVIELTKKVAGDDMEYREDFPEDEPVNTDGESAFAEGELTSKPKEEREETVS